MICPVCQKAINSDPMSCPQPPYKDGSHGSPAWHYQYSKTAEVAWIWLPPYVAVQDYMDNETRIVMGSNWGDKGNLPVFVCNVLKRSLVSDQEAISLIERIKKMEAFI